MHVCVCSTWGKFRFSIYASPVEYYFGFPDLDYIKMLLKFFQKDNKN